MTPSSITNLYCGESHEIKDLQEYVGVLTDSQDGLGLIYTLIPWINLRKENYPHEQKSTVHSLLTKDYNSRNYF